MATHPNIVCLCGSTRFRDEFLAAQRSETLAGNIVLSVGFFEQADGESLDAGTLERLAGLHRAKIDLADEILIIDRDGYVGESTAGEIAYAQTLDKPIRRWSNRAC